ncbi:hypothetical protein HMPREF1992_01359 [Selenomonas sp. oral taxon 892 str. F0426]|nr:hypothetical protein HMPREF1992_01359 [Selenomonas sp. oral taxon 892 str. F0426]
MSIERKKDCHTEYSSPYHIIGSTDKFSTAILTHLFCPHCVGKSST